VVDRALDEKKVDDLCEEEGEGIAIRTATLIVEGELELIMSCVFEIFGEFGRELVPSSVDGEAETVELGLKEYPGSDELKRVL